MNKGKALALFGLSLACAASLSAEQSKEATDVGTVSIMGEGESRANNSLSKTDLQELLTQGSNPLQSINKVPGVQFSSMDSMGLNDWSMEVSVRGFNRQQLGFVVDGIPTGNARYSGTPPMRLFDTENLEMVNVSQGTGDLGSPSASALGGTVKFETGMPKKEEGMTISYTTGSDDLTRSFFRYDTGAFNDGNTMAFFSISDTSKRKWTGDNGQFKTFHIDAKALHFNENDTYSLRFAFDDRKENDYYSYFSRSGVKKYCNQQFCWDGMTEDWLGIPNIDQNHGETWGGNRKNILISAKADLEVSMDSRVEITPYHHIQEGFGKWNPNYKLVLNDDGTLKKDADGNTIKNYDESSYRETEYDWRRTGATANYSHELGDHTITAGLWLEQMIREKGRHWYNLSVPQGSYIPDMSKPYHTEFYNDYTTDTKMLFAQDSINMMDDRLTVNVGAKVISAELDFEDRVSGAEDTVESTSSLLPSVGAIYKLAENEQVFINYSQTFRPLAESLYAEKVHQVDYSDVDEEKTSNIDLGYRTKMGSLSMALTLFDIRYENKHAEVDNTSDLYQDDGIKRLYNIDGSEIIGLESAFDYNPDGPMSYYVSYTRNVKYEYLDDDPSLGIKKGDHMVDMPENMLYAEANYRNNGYSLGLNGKYTGSKYASYDNGSKTDEDIVFNFNSGFVKKGNGMFKEFGMNFNVTNLLNNQHSYLYQAGTTGGSYGITPPRSYSLRLTASF